MNYEQRIDNQWVDVTDGEFVACCDCGLVHYFNYCLIGDRVLRRAIRNNKQTANQRSRTDIKQNIRKLNRKKKYER